jgi:hypothetical protein
MGDEIVTHADAIRVTDELNDLEMEHVGACHWSVTYCYDTMVVEWNGHHMWDSDEDDRLEIGTCKKCGGTGKGTIDQDALHGACESCGGDGKGEPREPLRDHLVRRLNDFVADAAACVLAAGGEPWTEVEGTDLVDVHTVMRMPKAVAEQLRAGKLSGYSIGCAGA